MILANRCGIVARFWHCDLQRTAWYFRSTDGIVALGRSNLLSPFPDDVYCYGTHPR